MMAKRCHTRSIGFVFSLTFVLLLAGLVGCGGRKTIQMDLTREIRYDNPNISAVTYTLQAPAGEESPYLVEVTVVGDPGLEGSFDISGVVSRSHLEETLVGGIYVGQFRFSPVSEEAYRVTGRLSHSEAGEAVMTSPDPIVVVAKPPSQETSCRGEFREALQNHLSGAIVHFQTNSAELDPFAQLILQRAVFYLSRYPACRVEVAGHADERGTDEYNLALALSRAEAVIAYLQEQAAAGNRLVAKSFGFHQPVSKDMAPNRRAEFAVLEGPE